jgi:hypothetical protein
VVFETALEMRTVRPHGQCQYILLDKKMSLNIPDEFWVGASDINGREPGHFFWADRREVDRTWWATSEPNSQSRGQQTCVVVKKGKLRDEPCHTTLFVSIVCKVGKQYSNCTL